MQSIHKIIVVVAVALIVGGFLGYKAGTYGAFSHGDRDKVPGNQEMRYSGTYGEMSHEMVNMMSALSGKTGDAFDKAFLEEMIKHHQGAVDMSDATLKNAQHQELKDMAQSIITTQKAEIEQMKQWQQEWYGITQPMVPSPSSMTETPQVQ